MGQLRGIATGVLALIVLDATVGTQNGPGATAGVIGWLAGTDNTPGVIGHLLSPDVPAIPDLRPASSSSSTHTSSAPARTPSQGGLATYDPRQPATATLTRTVNT